VLSRPQVLHRTPDKARLIEGLPEENRLAALDVLAWICGISRELLVDQIRHIPPRSDFAGST